MASPKRYIQAPPDLRPDPPRGDTGPSLNENEGYCSRAFNYSMSLNGDCVVGTTDTPTVTDWTFVLDFIYVNRCITQDEAEELWEKDDEGFYIGNDETWNADDYSNCRFTRTRYQNSPSGICDCPGSEIVTTNLISLTWTVEDDCCSQINGLSPGNVLYRISLELAGLIGSLDFGSCCEANTPTSDDGVPIDEVVTQKIRDYLIGIGVNV